MEDRVFFLSEGDVVVEYCKKYREFSRFMYDPRRDLDDGTEGLKSGGHSLVV